MMKTEIFSADRNSIILCAHILQHGGIIAFPTETVYGLGACIDNEESVKRIFEVKGRPQDNPLIVHIASLHQVYDIAENIPDDFFKLAEVFFPGSLTILLPKKKSVSDIITAGQPNVAVRMPNHKIALALIAETGIPLVAPSANSSGKPSPTKAQHVADDLSGKIDGIIDGGECSVGIESTVFGWIDSEAIIFRPGIITADDLKKVLGYNVRYWNESTITTLSPGMKYRHYSPDIPLYVVSGIEEIAQYYTMYSQKKMLLLTNMNIPDEYKSECTDIQPLHEKTLYAHFRESDKNGVAAILILPDENDKVNYGLMNRIQKAASGTTEL